MCWQSQGLSHSLCGLCFYSFSPSRQYQHQHRAVPLQQPSPCSLRSPARAVCWLPAHPSMPTPTPAPCDRVGTTAQADGTTQRNGDTPDRRRHQCHQMCLGETIQPSCLLPVNPTQCFVIKGGLNLSNPNSPMPRGSPDLQFKSRLSSS